jgi:hypothetical protein
LRTHFFTSTTTTTITIIASATPKMIWHWTVLVGLLLTFLSLKHLVIGVGVSIGPRLPPSQCSEANRTVSLHVVVEWVVRILKPATVVAVVAVRAVYQQVVVTASAIPSTTAVRLA